MDERLKQRLVGAAVLVSLGIIFIPMLLQGSVDEAAAPTSAGGIPPRPRAQFTAPIFAAGQPAENGPAEGTAPAQGNSVASQAAAPAEDAAAGGPNSPPADVETAQPASTPAPARAVGLTGWAVQLGAFSRHDNAVALVKELRNKGYTAFVDADRTQDDTLTRVLVGPELERADALAMQKRLKQEFKLDGMVIRYPGG